MNITLDLDTVRNFLIAILIGALVGIEREKRKLSEDNIGVAGLRTFIVFALIGAVSAWLTNTLHHIALFITGVVVASLTLVTGYVLNSRFNTSPHSLSITTELAAIAVCLLGGMAVFGQPELAFALAVILSGVLAYKQPLHGMVSILDWDDIFVGLRLLIATFIVLPLLPNEAIDPWKALNPYKLWLLVILISSLSLVGYIATRLLGPGRGIAFTGLSGGLVSSTAVTLSFAKRSHDRDGAQLGDALACGILLAWAVMIGRVVIEVLVVYAPLIHTLLLPLSLMAVTTVALAAWFYRRAHGATKPPTSPEVPLRNPFSLTQAIRFAAFFALVLLAVKIAQEHLTRESLYVVAGLAGLSDVDAITLSMAGMARSSGQHSQAAGAIIIALLSNTLVKGGLALTLGKDHLRRDVLIASFGIALSGAVGVLLI